MKDDSRWYAVYFIFSLEPIRTQPKDQLVRVQEDLVLLTAETFDEALEKALSFGSEVGRFGESWLSGSEDAPREIGLPEVDSSLRLNPALTKTYEGFTFLGVRDLVPLRGIPAHKTEIDCRKLKVGEDELSGMIPSEEHLTAFLLGESSGRLHPRTDESSGFHDHGLHLAEQIHWRAEHSGIQAPGESGAVERFVLIRGDDAEQAYNRAVEDAVEWAKGTGGMRFIGISELSPIEDEIEDGCELRSVIVDVMAGEDLVKYPAPQGSKGCG